jgi:L-fucose isomerase-like protein
MNTTFIISNQNHTVMRITEKKITFGVIVGTRGFFNAALAADGRRDLLAKLDQLGYGYIVLPEDATPTGAVETIDDARKVAKLFQENRENIDGIIVCLPNFGDELGIVNSVNWSKLNVPVLVQACDDDNDKVGVNDRRDAFCGKLSVCNNLYQYGIPFTNTTLHTCKIDSPVFEKDVHRFARVCRVVKGMTNARVGAIGARPAAFQTMRASEKILQASGITVIPVDMSEILGNASNINDNDPELKLKLDEIYTYGHIPSHVAKESIIKQAKFGIASERWINANEIDAAAFQCWTSIQENYGCATCLTMSMLSERLLPSACEVDICGTLSMYALALASGNPSALLDWNNNYGEERDKCSGIHCSNYPKSFFNSKIEIESLDVLGNTLGKDRCFGAVKGRVASGPFTYFRMSTDDLNGSIKAYVGEGQFTDDPYDMDGGVAICEVNNLQGLMNVLCKNGFEHHVAMGRDHVAGIIDEAINSYLGWDLYWHL